MMKLSAEIQKTVFDLTPEEFETACREAVAHREDVPTMDYVTRYDQEKGIIISQSGKRNNGTEKPF